VSEGPTALKGSWLQEPEREAPSEPEPPPEAEPAAPPPARALLAERLITPPEPEPRATLHLPALVRVACGALGLLAVGFALHFSTAGRWGLAAAGLGLALAGLGAVRLWMGHWDGLLAALLFCLGVAGSTRVRPDLWLANRVLLAGAALTLLLLLVAVIRRSGRDYFTT
jgi:hypothetical protein